MKMARMITKACTNCSACVEECPTGAIEQVGSKFVIDTDVCADHLACAAVCPVDAIHPFSIEAQDPSKKTP